jgi:hypothetical protein
MPADDSFDLLVQCGGCRIENLLSDYRPGHVRVCNQCRERLAGPASGETHQEYCCGDCGLRMLLLSETPVTTGQSECRCGGTNILILEGSSLLQQVKTLGDTFLDDEEAGEDFDWCRSGPETAISEDYNDLFDNDPGMN